MGRDKLTAMSGFPWPPSPESEEQQAEQFMAFSYQFGLATAKLVRQPGNQLVARHQQHEFVPISPCKLLSGCTEQGLGGAAGEEEGSFSFVTFLLSI